LGALEKAVTDFGIILTEKGNESSSETLFFRISDDKQY
jgi:hypothetical protein